MYKKRGISSIFLGLSQISGSLLLLSSLLTTTNLFKIFPILIGVPYPFLFFIGSFSFLYIRSLTEKDFQWNIKSTLIMIGPIAGILLSLPLYMMSDIQRYEYLQFIQLNNNYMNYDWIIWIFGLIYNWLILSLAYLKIIKYRKKLKQEFSNIDKIDLHIITRQLLLLIICWGGISLLSFLSFNRIIVNLSINLSALFPALYLIITSYSYLLNLIKTQPQETEHNSPKKIFSDENRDEHFKIIEQEMDKNKHFLNPELTLPVLAEKTSFYRNELSEIINHYSGTSFYHFVNRYRINYFKKLIMENKSGNILDMAMQSGFNSKGAFYNAFKKETGTTPKKFISNILV